MGVVATGDRVVGGRRSALDEFFRFYYRRNPVSATFTGVHDHDGLLPDWSRDGLASLDTEARSLGEGLRAHRLDVAALRAALADSDALDVHLAAGALEIQRAELASGHGVRGNPALWTGEAIFSIVSLITRDFAPPEQRAASALARLRAIPGFLADARAALDRPALVAPWMERARRDCRGGVLVFSAGVPRWIAAMALPTSLADDLRSAAASASAAVSDFGEWLQTRPAASASDAACGESHLELLLTHGHQTTRTAADLASEARERFRQQRAEWEASAIAAGGSWDAVQAQLSSQHASATDFLPAFERVWREARDAAVAADVVTWPTAPIRYVTYPDWTREAAPHLYYLHYRSPAPFDTIPVHDYVVPAPPADDTDSHLRAWNYGVMKLNHVVHHGGIGHHVQNWYATNQARSLVGRVAAVDCANRIGMLCGGTMAEGWASYVVGLMEELGYLSPLEQVVERHTGVRMLGRAIVDLELHRGAMSMNDAAKFYVEEVGMSPAAAAGEVTRNSMFPGTAIMYWLGTQGIRELRDTVRTRRGAAWSLKVFHEELLGFGSIPVPLVARLMA
jgi:Bacterial protein of unknown function (DUF885)